MPVRRRALESIQPYIPGKPLEDVLAESGITEMIKLNQNENPLGPSPLAMVAVKDNLALSHTYPEASSRQLREKLALLWDLPSAWFTIGNGSGEIFRLLAQAYLEPDDGVVVPAVSFAGYTLVAQLMGAEVFPVPLKEGTMDLEEMGNVALRKKAKFIFLCRPNNPTGSIFAEASFSSLLSRLSPETIVVLDQAYEEYSEDPFPLHSFLKTYPALVITRTFSKIYGLAGLRLGYGLAHPDLLAPLQMVRDPFSINRSALSAGLAALSDQEHLKKSRLLNREGKIFLGDLFSRLSLPYYSTQANFILFDAGESARKVYETLLQGGVLVRPCASFGLPTHLRVTIGLPEENQHFASLLENLYSILGGQFMVNL